MASKVRESVASAMAPVKRTATKAEGIVDKAIERGYVKMEVRIQMPEKFAAVLGIPAIVIEWRIYL